MLLSHHKICVNAEQYEDIIILDQQYLLFYNTLEIVLTAGDLI